MGGGGAVHTGSWVYVLKHSEERMQPTTWEVPRADPILRALCRGQKAGTGSSFCPKWWLMLGTQQKGQTCVYCCAVLLTLVHGRADGAEAAAPCWDGCLVAAAAWEHGCAQGLFPALSWHTGPSWQSRKPSLCSLPRWLGPEFVFGNCSERHCTLPCPLPSRKTGKADDGGLREGLSCPAPLKDFSMFHFDACLKRLCRFPRRKVKYEISAGSVGT